MNDLFIKDNYARLDRTDRATCEQRGVRLYKCSPFAAAVQIRSHTEKMGYYMTASLDADECRAVAAKLLEIADTLVPDVPTEHEAKLDDEQEFVARMDAYVDRQLDDRKEHD